MTAPFIPAVGDNFDEKHANEERTLSPTEQEELFNKKMLLRRDSIQHLFNGYYFDYEQDIKEKADKLQSDEKNSLQDKSTRGQTASRDNFFSVLNTNQKKYQTSKGERPSEQKQQEFVQKPQITEKSAQNSIRYRPENQKQIFEMTIDSEQIKPDQFKKDIKKLEREDFNNIIGVVNKPNGKPKKSRMEKTSQFQSSQPERYKIEKLEELLIVNDENKPENKKLVETSEPDNDRAHQLYDQQDSSEMYDLYN